MAYSKMPRSHAMEEQHNDLEKILAERVKLDDMLKSKFTQEDHDHVHRHQGIHLVLRTARGP